LICDGVTRRDGPVGPVTTDGVGLGYTTDDGVERRTPLA
jgi:hypothetical protein